MINEEYSLENLCHWTGFIVLWILLQYWFLGCSLSLLSVMWFCIAVSAVVLYYCLWCGFVMLSGCCWSLLSVIWLCLAVFVLFIIAVFVLFIIAVFVLLYYSCLWWCFSLLTGCNFHCWCLESVWIFISYWTALILTIPS